jgi:catechol 2,3-dioxygenase-like lactoylglutathione lyase family enzyme
MPTSRIVPVEDLRPMDHGIRLSTVNINAPDPSALGAFYARLLGWEVVHDEPGWVVIGLGDDYFRISFEEDVNYQRPVWPSEAGKPPIQMHLDIRVTDLDGAVKHAQECGAVLADSQPQDDVRVCLDPAGHAFCLWLDASAS